MIKPTRDLQYLTYNEVNELKANNCLISAIDGGLLLGPSHANGGIFMLYQYSERFRVIGEVEGYEYIVKAKAARRHSDRISEIGNMKRDFYEDFFEYPIDINIQTINAISTNKDLCNSKFMVMDFQGGWSIVNKYSTSKYLTELDAINKGLI